MNEKIICALVGLAGATGNNGKTHYTDSIVMNALLNCYSPVDEDPIVAEIKKEKYTISPNCETCPTGAITFETREAAAYDEAAVEENKKKKTTGSYAITSQLPRIDNASNEQTIKSKSTFKCNNSKGKIYAHKLACSD